MKQLKTFLAIAIFIIFCSTVWADIPNLINFQGILDSSGNPLANRTVSVQFKIYNDSVASLPANIKWSETQSVTTNAGGIFNVLLGSSNPVPDSAFKDTLRWLGIKVGTDAEMSPRQQIVSNAYGYRVGTVDGATGGTIFGNTSIQSNLYVDGNVGIGTTNPVSKLEVVNGDLKVITNPGQNSTTLTQGTVLTDNGSSATSRYVSSIGGIFTWGVGKTHTGNNDFHIVHYPTSRFDITVAGNSGNVGIGTTNPKRKLHVVSGSSPFFEEGLVLEHSGAPVNQRIWEVASLNTGSFQIRSIDDAYSAGTSRFLITNSGNVGIGTAAPTELLEIYKNDADGLIRFQDFGDAEFKVGIDVTGATRRFRIAPTPSNADPGSVSSGLAMDYSSGNVGIGTTSPSSSYRLHVYKPGQSSALLEINNPGFGEILGLKNADSTGDAAINFFSGQSYIGNMGLIRSSLPKRFFILSNNPSNLNLTLVEAGGNVCIGTTSPGNILSVVQNSATDPIADAWTTYSSAEYKQGIHELTDEEYSEALHKLLNTPVVKFRYKGQSFMDKEKIGIVIEEAPEEIVSEGNTKAASLSEYISLLHAGLKAQQTEIESLKQMLKQLQDEQSEK